MHLAKIVLLLAFTLAVMRAFSWLAYFCISRALRRHNAPIVALSNGIALGGFMLIQYLDSLPGEGVDTKAVLFGTIVFTLFAVLDLKWLPVFLRARE